MALFNFSPPRNQVVRGEGANFALSFNGMRKWVDGINVATPRALDRIVKLGAKVAQEFSEANPTGRKSKTKRQGGVGGGRPGHNIRGIQGGRPNEGTWAVWGSSGYSLYIEKGTGIQNIDGQGNPSLPGRFAAPVFVPMAENIRFQALQIVAQELRGFLS